MPDSGMSIRNRAERHSAVICRYVSYIRNGIQSKVEKEEGMKAKLYTHICFLIAAAMVFWACAGPKVEVEPITDTGNPGEQVSRLDSEVGVARKNQINVLAPVSFAVVEKNLGEAKGGLMRGDEISGILEKTAQGRAYLKRAEESAKMARTALSNVIKARDDARAAGAPSFEKDYADAESRFLELTGAIEKDNLKWAQKNEAEVIETFRSLEIRAIKEKTLGEVRDTIDRAEKEGAKKLVPELYAEARKELDSVDAFISENPYQKEEMLKRANTALFNAQRLVVLTQQSGKLQTMKPVETVLWTEGMITQITNKLSAPDMRNHSFDTQMENILGTIGAVQADRKFLGDETKSQQAEIEMMMKDYRTETETLKKGHDAEIASLTSKISALEGKSKEEQAEKQRIEAEKRANEARLAEEKRMVEQRLAAERLFNEMYNEVQAFFEPEEADVYKQGDKLVIRLKSIKFPIGKAIIMPENYALLSKVQKAVRTFGEPEVLIEGHTDSTGSTAVNELLSQKRAEAVQEYLVANQTVPVDKITSIGYGSIRPLASNATEEGRAINRRIDIIISPITRGEQ